MPETENQNTAPPSAGPPPADHLGSQVERFSIAANFTPATSDDDNRTIDAVWYTSAKVPRFDWSTGEEYDLILDMNGCRLDRLNNGAPVLDSHQAYGVENQLGVVRKGWVEGSKGMATFQFSQRDAVTPIWNDVKSGIIQNLSPGLWIYSKKETTPDKQARKEFTATDWEPFEISLVPVPADASTTFMSAAGVEPAKPAAPSVAAPAVTPEVAAPAVAAPETERASAQHQGAPELTPTTQDAGDLARQNEQNLSAARIEGAKQERLRVSAIRTMAAPFKLVAKTFVTALIDEGVTVEVARERIMTNLAAQSNNPPTDPRNEGATAVTSDATDKRRECMEAALFLRGTPNASREIQDKGRDYAGLTLVDMGRECLEAAGIKTRGMSRFDIASVALTGRLNDGSQYFAGTGSMTTSDFPNILANVANKTLRQAYQASPRTFTPFCRQVSASDFKPVNRVQLSDIASLQKTNEKGEFHRVYLSDSKETYSLATWGGIVPITRKVIVNDDLQALTRIPAGLGVAAATLESDTVWAVITGNPTMGDSVALFHATHKNLNTSNALALAALGTARTAFRKQTGPKGTILNLIPRYLVLPAALETTGLQLVYPINLAATAATGVVPSWVQSLTPIIEPRLDAASNGATNWFMAADPSMIDTIEYCYLEGQQGVFIETRQGFDVDGIEIKARLDFAAAAIDFRGLAKNAA